MSENRLLIIFAKNPEKEHVKTRLAKTLGEQKALEIYRTILGYTLSVADGCECDKELWYSRFIPEQDEWGKRGFRIQLQQGEDLGERMKHAFRRAFKNSYPKVVIIGSDCAELTPDLISDSYQKLDKHDLVIGPSEDGGYYLLGMNELYGRLFEDIPWSTSEVLAQTMEKAKALGLDISLLPELNDVDNETDWQSVKDKF